MILYQEVVDAIQLLTLPTLPKDPRLLSNRLGKTAETRYWDLQLKFFLRVEFFGAKSVLSMHFQGDEGGDLRGVIGQFFVLFREQKPTHY